MQKILSYIIYIALIVVGLSEIVLRCIGYQPGQFRKYEDFTIVDSLVVYKNFDTDEVGNLKFSSWITDSIPKYLDYEKEKITNPHLIDSISWGDDIENNYLELHKTLSLKNSSEFSRFINSIQQKKQQSSTDSAILRYVNNPYNSDGYRSIPFEEFPNKEKTSVLILGASHVYGMGAHPIYHSFADILLSRKYLVYNTGIPGVDLAQYHAVGKKYITLLNPDIVILIFSDEKDLMNTPRRVKKNEHYEHCTNAGFFLSNPEDKYLDAEEAYLYYLSLQTIPNRENNSFNYYCSKSSITSLLWGILLKLNLVEHKRLSTYSSYRVNQSKSNRATISKKYVRLINELCNQNHSKILNVVIPDFSVNNLSGNSFSLNSVAIESVFNQDYHVLRGISNQNIDVSRHFNNSGHLKCANFLDSLINEEIVDHKF